MGQEPGDLTLREFKVFQPEEKMLFQANIGVRSEQLNIDELVEKVCNQEQISIKELVKRTRIQKVSDIRKAIVLLSERHCNVTNTLLAQELNLPLSMISKIKSGESKGTGYVQEIIWRFEGNK
jgi:putative transposase